MGGAQGLVLCCPALQLCWGLAPKSSIPAVDIPACPTPPQPEFGSGGFLPQFAVAPDTVLPK